jgi:pilus assembly protein Flp/PilA
MRSWRSCRFESMTNVKRQAISQLVKDDRGVTAIEYALIAALIAVAAIAAFTLVGTNLSDTFTTIANQL